MRKKQSKRADELRPEYDLSSLSGGVRGKYLKQAASDTNVVVLDPDNAREFPDDESVNKALRGLVKLARETVRRSGRSRSGHA
jgi:hypothetical protein